MAHQSCMDYVRSALGVQDVAGLSLIEVGSANINGSARDYLESLRPAQYIGVDIEPGPGVDVICDARRLVERFGPETFDIVVSTEMLEHVMDWRSTVENLKAVLRPGGVAVLTTRSIGFPLHGYPFDFWRYELADMEQIFGDFESVEVSSDPDPERPGVFVRAIKPTHMGAHAVDLSKIRLYNIIWRRRTERASAAGLIQFAWYVWRHTKAFLPGSLRSRMVRLASGIPPSSEEVDPEAH